MLTKEKIDAIIKAWKTLKENIKRASPPLTPQSGFITVPPMPYNTRRNKDKKENYKKEIKAWIAKNNIQKIQQNCYFYVEFKIKKRQKKPDVDNLLKLFFDAVKDEKDANKKVVKTGMLGDDGQVIGIKSQLINIPDGEREGIFFNMVPAHTLKILSVENIGVEELESLNQLRKRYFGDAPITEWKKPRQMITTDKGVFFDNEEGKLWSIEPHEQKGNFLYKPEPGFGWKAKEGKEIDGVIIYERSACWWINKLEI